MFKHWVIPQGSRVRFMGCLIYIYSIMMNLVVTWMLMIALTQTPTEVIPLTLHTNECCHSASARPLQLLTLFSCWLSATLSVIVSPWFQTEGGRGDRPVY